MRKFYDSSTEFEETYSLLVLGCVAGSYLPRRAAIIFPSDKLRLLTEDPVDLSCKRD